MREQVLAALQSGAFRRIVVFALTPLLVLANAKLKLDLSAEAIAAVVVSTVIYLVQSAWKEAAVKKAEALVAQAGGPAAVLKEAAK